MQCKQDNSLRCL